MSTGDSAAWPALALDMRATIPQDKRASMESAYAPAAPAARWAPPPPRPSLKLIAAWLLFTAAAIASLYMADRTGKDRPHAGATR